MIEPIRLKGNEESDIGYVSSKITKFVISLYQLKEQLDKLGYEIVEKRCKFCDCSLNGNHHSSECLNRKEEKQPEKKDDIVEELLKIRNTCNYKNMEIPVAYLNDKVNGLINILITKFGKEKDAR